MVDSPERCPTCSTVVPDGAERCPGCGRVFGEANRCPHCHAIAAVIDRGSKTVCAACGKPRVGATVLGGTPKGAGAAPRTREGQNESTSAMLLRARGRTQRGAGIIALAIGVFAAAALAMIVPGALGLGLAAAMGALFVAVGALAVRGGARSMEEARRRDRRATELALLEAARAAGGRLTATEAAAALRVSVEEADAQLTDLVGDGSRVDVDVDDEGVLRYVFRELATSQVKVRVDASDDAGPPEEPHELEAEAERAERSREER